MSVIVTTRNLREALPKAQAGRNESSVIGAGEPLAPNPPSELAQPKPDDQISRVLKMVPGEATAGYTAALTFFPGEKYAGAVAFLGCCVVLILALRRSGQRHSPPVKPDPMQYGFQLLAFAAWAFAIRNPLAGFGVQVAPWMTGLAIIFIPIIGALVMADGDAPAAAPGAS